MIRIPQVMVVDEDGEQLGVLDTQAAIALAEDKGLDLVEVAPTARPPVCKIMDYGKFKYEQAKKAKKAKQASHTVKVKTIKFRPKTDDHDYEFKVKRALGFLGEGHRVVVTVLFRGREMAFRDRGRLLLQRLTKDLEDAARPEQAPRMEGRRFTMVFLPLKSGSGKRPSGRSKKKSGRTPKAESKPEAPQEGKAPDA